MKGKLIFVAGAAVGYVLGARAGRKRYEQIAAAAGKIWHTPGVQRQVHTVEDFAAARVGEIPGLVVKGAKRAAKGTAHATRAAADRASSSDAPGSDDSGSSGSAPTGGGTALR